MNAALKIVVHLWYSALNLNMRIKRNYYDDAKRFKCMIHAY